LKVRIVGIDAPEICQLGGPEARDALRGHVLGQPVTLTSLSARSHDDFGRVLATLDKQGEDVGRWMVRRGQAWSYSYRRHPGPYAVEQAQAHAAGAGLFSHAAAENPRSFRQRHGSCHP
jgi:endonuclease YncB( thermonuclease family)